MRGWTMSLVGPERRTGVTDADGRLELTVSQPGSYVVSEVQGPGWRPTTPTSVNLSVWGTAGEVLPEIRFGNRLNNNAQFIELDRLQLQAGPQQIEVTYEQGGLPRPGTGAYPFGLGPVVFSQTGFENAVIRLPASRFTELCGQRLDWIEALR